MIIVSISSILEVRHIPDNAHFGNKIFGSAIEEKDSLSIQRSLNQNKFASDRNDRKNSN
jgi:hypothetical protein